MAFKPNSHWEYTIEEVKEWMDTPVVSGGGGGNNEITGLLLPTPTTSRTTAVETFTWYHLAPMVGFKVTRNNSTVTITSVPEYGYCAFNRPYNAYPYSEWSPKITFSYKTSSGSYVDIGSFGNATQYDGTSVSATINGVDQIAIYVTCDAPTCGLYDTQNFLGYIKLHSHISAPAAPKISSTTGKTITVTNGEDGIQCTTTNSAWYDSPNTFTGFSQGNSYSFRCRAYCDGFEGDSNHIFYSTTVTGKTWSITGQHVASGSNSIVFKATHVAGTGSITATDRTITYRLYESKNTSGAIIATKNGNSGSAVTFSGLESGKTYYCFAFTTNLGNGDNNCWIEAGATKEETQILGNSGDVSAKTLRASVSWNAGGASSVSCTIQCNGQSRSLSSSGQYVGFTGLTPNTTYSVTWKIVSIYTYTYKYTEIDENGKEVEKTGTGQDTVETTGGTSLTTKQAKFGSPVNVTSKIIQFKSSSNYSSDTMEQRISSNNSWNSVGQNTYSIYDNLTHNTSYTIYCRIAGCYAFNTSGSQTTVNDSEISQTVSTHLLSLSASISEEHQHSLVTLWQAYVNGVATNSDAIDGTLFEFSYMDTLARKSNPPYQASEVVEGSNGTTTGDYQSNKKIYSNNLTWYYCEYIVTASITDGYNIVANTITCHTLFPATWIYSGGQWHRYMGHVYTNGKYVPAPVFVYKNNKYNESNGE